MIKPPTPQNEWQKSLTRLRDLGAPLPDHVDCGGTFTHTDPDGKNTRDIGGWWVAPRDVEEADLVTWLLPGIEIDSATLSEKERYMANLVAVRQLIDRITIVRTGHAIDATTQNDKLRTLRQKLQQP